MEKLFALFGLFKAGSSVADPSKWKGHQITATMLAVLILAIGKTLHVFGYEMPLDAETATAIGAGIIAVVNVVLTIVTTDKIGLQPKQADSSVLPSTEAAAEVQPVSPPAAKESTADRDKRIFGNY